MSSWWRRIAEDLGVDPTVRGQSWARRVAAHLGVPVKGATWARSVAQQAGVKQSGQSWARRSVSPPVSDAGSWPRALADAGGPQVEDGGDEE